MRVTLRIQRFNPEKDQKPWWGDYVAEVEPDERLLDALYYVKSYVDGTLTFRHSCVHGVCGSDAMRINGRNTLACQVLVKNLGATITIEPLPGLRVVKDLLVDMERFFELYQSVHPYFISYSPPPERSGCNRPRTGCDSTTRPSASSVPAVRARARPIGPTRITWGRRRSSTRTGSCSTAATRVPTSGWRFWAAATAFGAAARSSTASRPARETSRSRVRLPR